MKMLSKNLKNELLARFINSVESYNEPGERELARSILNVSMEANIGRFDELKEGLDMNAATEEFFKEELQQRDEKNQEKGQEDLVSAISELKAGTSSKELSSRGYGKHTIDMAMKCINML